MQDTTSPTCTLSANESGLTATATDNNTIVYQGWSSSYSGSNSTSKDIADIAVGTYTYYVKDKAGNKGSCSIEVISTTKNENQGFENWRNGTCDCQKRVGSGHQVLVASCNAMTCNCPSDTTMTRSCDSVRLGIYCASGEEQVGNKCISYSCPTGYSKMNNSYCYK